MFVNKKHRYKGYAWPHSTPRRKRGEGRATPCSMPACFSTGRDQCDPCGKVIGSLFLLIDIEVYQMRELPEFLLVLL